MAESVMVRHPDRYYGWDYVTGVMTKAFELLWLETGDDRFRQYVVKTVDPVIAEDGTMASVEMAILEDGRK
jgi:rhamnogalacturonyl hydrolase YesR